MKRDIYAEMGVTEYWRFDNNRGQVARRVLVAERLNAAGEYEPLAITQQDRALTAYSAVLGLDFFAQDGALRMYDPVSRTWLRNFREEIAARQLAEERAESAEGRAQTAEGRAAMPGADAPGTWDHAAQRRLTLTSGGRPRRVAATIMPLWLMIKRWTDK